MNQKRVRDIPFPEMTLNHFGTGLLVLREHFTITDSALTRP